MKRKVRFRLVKSELKTKQTGCMTVGVVPSGTLQVNEEELFSSYATIGPSL